MSAVMTNPPKAARFWNRIAKKYARDPVANQAAYEYKLDQTARILKPDMRVFEFGCGTGTTSLIHADRVASIDAIDFSEAMINIAKEKAEKQGTENVHFHVASIEDWDKDGYDVVMAHSVLHLVADLDGTLAKVRKLLKPGGMFVSSTVCLSDMGAFWPMILPIPSALGLIPKVRPLNGENLAARIESHGFKIETFWRPDEKSSVFLIAKAV